MLLWAAWARKTKYTNETSSQISRHRHPSLCVKSSEPPVKKHRRLISEGQSAELLASAGPPSKGVCTGGTRAFLFHAPSAKIWLTRSSPTALFNPCRNLVPGTVMDHLSGIWASTRYFIRSRLIVMLSTENHQPQKSKARRGCEV